MASFSDYLELELLDHVFKVGTYTQPTNIYIALLTATPSDSDTGTTISANEPSGGAYARKVHNTWNTAAAGSLTNNGIIQFATATANWGTIHAFALTDSLTVGNMLAWGHPTTKRNVQSGDRAQFNDTTLKVTLD